MLNQNLLFKKINLNPNTKYRYRTPKYQPSNHNIRFINVSNNKKNNIKENNKAFGNKLSNNLDYIQDYNSELNHNIKYDQLKNIDESKQKINNYEMAINEIANLNSEINKLNIVLKNKNSIIFEFENLANISKNKITSLINRKNNNQINETGNIFEEIKKLEVENENLGKKLIFLENENKSLKKQFDLIDNNYIDFSNKFPNNQDNNIEIIKLENKYNIQQNIENILDEIKNKYYILEKQLKEKDENIRQLSIMNNNLEKQIKKSNENCSKIRNEQLSLQSKLNALNKKCKDYECTVNNINHKKNNTNDYSFFTYDNDYQTHQNSNDISFLSQGPRTYLTSNNFRENNIEGKLNRSYVSKPRHNLNNYMKYSNYLVNKLKNDVSDMKFDN